MILKERISADDIDALENILLGGDWQVIVKYIEELHLLRMKKFFDKKPDDMLLYERGVVEGSKQLLNDIKELKEYYKNQTSS